MSRSAFRYAAIVLAAGESKRFGARNKLLHEVDGVPLLRRVLRAFEVAGVVRVLVVLGHESEQVGTSLAGLEVETVVNSRYAEGMGTSLACGASVLDETRLDGVLLCVGDLPRLDGAHVESVQKTFEEAAGASAIVPIHKGVRGHPVCIPAAQLPLLRTLSGDEGAKRVFPKGQNGVLLFEMLDAGCIQDLDSIDR